MASIHKEMLVDAALEEVWAAIRERIIDIDDRLRRLAYAIWRPLSMA
jgi:hypothetical protein